MSTENEETETGNVSESNSTTVSIVDDVMSRLKTELRKAQPFPNGTLVRFTSVDVRSGMHYHYAALFTAGYWWFTGQGNSHFPKSASQQEFSALMVANGHKITDLALATSFAPIEL